VGFSVEISPIEAGEFFRASAVPGLEAVLEAQKKSASFLIGAKIPPRLCLVVDSVAVLFGLFVGILNSISGNGM
jgi:hypothetical protein